jgi:hypothetical protein
MWVVDSPETLGWESLSNDCELPRSYLHSRAKSRLDLRYILYIFLYFVRKYKDCIAAREPACRNDLTASPNRYIRYLYDFD